ncbi:acyclic terpene utilization AtuA family protein [Achromobacter xylosoxidans]|nr:acyclic terpene utilization AtuA family protein [Achromobacter xylosoxidans]
MTRTVFIGSGAGFADERPDAGIHVAKALATCNGPRYIVYENLGERTLALAQKERHRDPNAGYTPQLESFLRPTLRFCKENNIRVVGNFGAANPIGAGKRIMEMARELGVGGLKVAVVTGDDLLEYVAQDKIRSWPIVEGIPLPDTNIISANVYIGAQPIQRALATGADVVVLGRVTDSALLLGPLMHEFGWKEDQWDLMAAGTLAGHLLECSAQITGGYFADPGYKDVPDLARIGFPIAEVSATGECVITKPPGTGGRVSLRTVKEQMLYEIHDPSAYLVPDVTLDITGVELEQIGEDRVRVSGARGKPRPPTLKVTVCTDGGWLGEGEITYAGPNSLARAQLAEQVLRERMMIMEIDCPIRIDIVGTISTFDSDAGTLRRLGTWAPDGDYRVRIAGKSFDKNTVESVTNELIALYTSGPAGGGGVRRSLVSRVQTHSALVDPDVVRTNTTILSTEKKELS